MRQRLESGEPEKSASPFNGMDEAKNVAEDFAVAGLMLETDDFRIDALEILVGLGKELP